MFLAQGTHGSQPDVEDAERAVAQSGGHASALGVAADDDLLDLEVADGVLDDGEHVGVGGVDDVCDVAVDEDVAGLEAEHGGLGDAGVRAAEP